MSYISWIKEKIGNRRVCVYPMGLASKHLVKLLNSYGIAVDFFSDGNEKLWGKSRGSIPCISWSQLVELEKGNLIVLIESEYYQEIKIQLQALGIKNMLRVYSGKINIDKYFCKHKYEDIEMQIAKVLGVCSDEQSRQVFSFITNSWHMEKLSDDYYDTVYRDIKYEYFDESIFSLSDKENVVDAGAYIGDTAIKFLEQCDSKFEKLHLFELDSDIFKKLNDNMRQFSDDKICCYPYGLGNQNGSISYIPGDANSTVTDNGNIGSKYGEIRKLDDVLTDEPITLIKMDIEGAETDALLGAEKIIKKQKPKLAICIYHSVEDMLTIPLLIKKMVPEYRILIRHYAHGLYDTVCYAVIS